ncbi:Aquaporin-9 [Toxocara canis]|uniref:Aquaporin-9 n=1 Tax=Toxocara canis TaxID=6265 RepID=A0A0B2VRF1_TOXCA|nr:Aquaporin-9 [Toxocara canis]
MVFTPDLLRRKCRIRNKLGRNSLAEFFGTFLLIYIGLSIVAQYLLTHERVNVWININVGWGFNIVFSVLTVQNLSGGHLNPAISLLMYTFGELELLHLFAYCVAQMLGAFLGAAATYYTYLDAINAYEKGPLNRTVVGATATAAIFSTYPASHLSMSGAYVDQIAGTAMLALFACAIIDKRNKVPSCAHAVLFGFVVLLIGCTFGMNVGYPINPARDLAPRIFSYFIYGRQVFTHPYPSWFLVPVIGPCVGAVVGGWMYHAFSGIHIPDEGEDKYQAVDQDELKAKNAGV